MEVPGNLLLAMMAGCNGFVDGEKPWSRARAIDAEAAR